MKRHPTTFASPIRPFLAFLVAVLVLCPIAAHAQTSPCEDLCIRVHSAAYLQCVNTYNACLAVAAGDPELEAACTEAYIQCTNAVDADYASCIAACHPPLCTDECNVNYNALIVLIEQDYQTCVSNAFGDLDAIQECINQRAAALVAAASQLQICLAACPATATEPTSWGAVKGLYQ